MLDLVEGFSSGNTSQMRYREQTTKFWQIGFRLFHGKFLRFMSGLGNSGQIPEFESSLKSKINFAVPSRNHLYQRKCDDDLFYPGIQRASIMALVDHFKNTSLKLAVDGKQIGRGKGKRLGDIDSWVFESKPTLQERRECHLRESEFVKTVQEKIERFEDHGCSYFADISNLVREDIVKNLKDIVKSVENNLISLRKNFKS